MRVNKGYIYLFFTAFLFSLGGLLVKLIDMHPIAINGSRSLIALITLFIYQKSFKIKANKLTVLGGVCLVLTNILFVIATKMTTAANAIVLQYTTPIYVLIFSSIYYKKLPSIKQVFVILLALSGMILFFFDQLEVGMLLGNILALLSGVTFSGVFFINGLDGVEPIESTKIAYIIGFIIGIPFMTNMNTLDTTGFIALLILGIFQLGLAYIIFGKAIKMVSSVEASLICLSEAIMNPLWVLLVVKEVPGLYAIIGACIVVLAIILNIFTEKREKQNAKV